MSDYDSDSSVAASLDSEIDNKKTKSAKKFVSKSAKDPELGSDQDVESDADSDAGSESDQEAEVAESESGSDLDSDLDELPSDAELFGNEDEDAPKIKESKKAAKTKTGKRGAEDETRELEAEYFGDSDYEDDDDYEDEYGEEYLQKFDETIREAVLENHHRELLHHNYEEVETLAKVLRDERGIIVDPLHRTVPILTKYEKARILGERAKQINGGAKPFVKVREGIIDGYIIACEELEQKKIPFIIRRPINGGFEYWRLADLEVL